MEKQIYKYTFEEVKELTYNQIKVLSVIRQFSIDCISKINTSEIINRTKLASSTVSFVLKELCNKHYIEKDDKEYIILKPIVKGSQFLYWVDDDLSLGLTYNQFVLYCLIRTNSNKFGYAMLKYSTISNLTGIADTHISRAMKQLIEKELIRIEKQNTFTKYWIIEKSKYEEYIDNSDNEKVEDAEKVELPKEIQQIVAEDKKEQTIYDRVAGIFGWDKLPKIGIDLINAAYQTYNYNRVDIGNIIYGCLDKAKYTITTNAEFKNKSAEFVYWWRCADKDIKKSYTGRIRSIDNLDKMAAIEAQEDEEERKRIEAFKQKRYEEMRNENNEEAWFADEIDY